MRTVPPAHRRVAGFVLPALVIGVLLLSGAGPCPGSSGNAPGPRRIALYAGGRPSPPCGPPGHVPPDLVATVRPGAGPPFLLRVRLGPGDRRAPDLRGL